MEVLLHSFLMSTLVIGMLSNSCPGRLAAGKTNSRRGWVPQPFWTALEKRKSLVAIGILTLDRSIHIYSSTTWKQCTVKQKI